jgi:integrase
MEYVQPIRDKKQIEAMKKILAADSLRNHCLFVLGINSGLRISDLLNLRIGDVVENRKVKDRIEVKEKKTKKVKNFPLGPSARKAVEEYLNERFGKVRDAELDEALFLSRKGGVTYSITSMAYIERCRAASRNQ